MFGLKIFFKFGAFGKVCVDQGMEPPADVGGDISAEGKVKPCDVSAAVFSLLLFVVTLPVTEEHCSFTKTTVCQGVVKHGLGVFK